MELNMDNLKSMAAKAVADSASGESLNSTFTKCAVDNNLNADQVKRLVETGNQLCYLSKLAEAEDRTFEFEPADYDSVLNGVVADPIVMMKEASLVSDIENILSPTMEKVAHTGSEPDLDVKMSTMVKLAAHAEHRLKELEHTKTELLYKLAHQKESLLREPDALEKMAQFDNGNQMAKLVFGKEASETKRIFEDEDLSSVKYLSETLDMAKQASQESKALSEQVTKAYELKKQAFIAPLIRGAVKAVSPGKGPNAVTGFLEKSKTGKKILTAGRAAEAADGMTTVSGMTKRRTNAWDNLRG